MELLTILYCSQDKTSNRDRLKSNSLLVSLNNSNQVSTSLILTLIAPREIGPGSYIGKKATSMTAATSGLLNTTQNLQQTGMYGTQRGNNNNNLHFGVTDRFPDLDKTIAQPGPGTYND